MSQHVYMDCVSFYHPTSDGRSLGIISPLDRWRNQCPQSLPQAHAESGSKLTGLPPGALRESCRLGSWSSPHGGSRPWLLGLWVTPDGRDSHPLQPQTCLLPASSSWWSGSQDGVSFQRMKSQPRNKVRASLVAQWLRIRLPMQGTRVRALVWEDPTCRGAAGPVSHNCWACASGACAPQQERPRWWEARAPRWRGAPACHNWRKPSHRDKDPTQPEIN